MISPLGTVELIMIRAHIITPRNKALYENEFDGVLRRRHDAFVRQKGVTHDYASPGHFTVKATNLETGQGGTV